MSTRAFQQPFHSRKKSYLSSTGPIISVSRDWISARAPEARRVKSVSGIGVWAVMGLPWAQRRKSRRGAGSEGHDCTGAPGACGRTWASPRGTRLIRPGRAPIISGSSCSDLGGITARAEALNGSVLVWSSPDTKLSDQTVRSNCPIKLSNQFLQSIVLDESGRTAPSRKTACSKRPNSPVVRHRVPHRASPTFRAARIPAVSPSTRSASRTSATRSRPRPQRRRTTHDRYLQHVRELAP